MTVAPAMESWICPNDRHLTLRAKLNTGWSYHSVKNKSKSEPLSGEEMDHIVRVIKRSEHLDEVEQKRVGIMVDRLQNMQRLACGNGSSQCVLCGHEFRLLGAKGSRCGLCGKAVCGKCAIDGANVNGQSVWLCKLCSENRELWKRSGAWFYKALPHYILPCPKNRTRPVPVSANASANASPGATPERQAADTQTTWTHVRRRRHSSSSSDSLYSLGATEAAPSESEAKADLLEPGVGPSGAAERQPPMPAVKPGPDVILPGAVIIAATASIEDPVQRLQQQQQEKEREDKEKKSDESLSAEDGEGSKEESPDEVSPIPSVCKTVTLPGTSKLGYLEFSIFYNALTSQLAINIIRAKNLLARDRNGLSDPYVKLHLLPGGDHRTKLRTKTVFKSLQPEWNETLVYHGLTMNDMMRRTLRFLVLDEDLVGSDWLGEFRMALSELVPNSHLHLIVPLSPKQEAFEKEHVGRSRGRILLALRFSPDEGTLMVKIIRCAELTAMDPNGYSDPFVKIHLMPDPKNNCKRRTTVKKKTLNPYFNEDFVFEVNNMRIITRKLHIEVWDHDRATTNDFIGGVELSLDGHGDCLRHWYDMFNHPNKRLEMWHTLTKS